MPSANETDSDNLPDDLPSDSLVEKMFLSIKYGGYEQYFSKELLALYTEALSLPDEELCCDAKNDWIHHLICSMEWDTLTIQDIETQLKGDAVLADVDYLYYHFKDESTKDFGNKSSLSIIREDGHWALDNFTSWGERIKEKLIRCNAENRRYFRSYEWDDDLEYIWRCGWDALLEALQKEQAYFKQYPVPADSLLPDSSILQLFSAIPSYEPGNPEVFHYDSLQMRAAFSDSLYSLITEAFKVWGMMADEPLGGIWLNGLVCGWHHGFYGNRDDSMHIVGVRQEYVNDSLKASVRVIFRTYDEKPVVGRYVEHYFHSFKLYLKQESGQWVIDNFEVRPMTREEIPGKATATDMKALCRHYIDEERKWMKDEGWMRAWRKDCADQRQKLMQDSVANADALRRHDEFVRQSEEYFKGL